MGKSCGAAVRHWRLESIPCIEVRTEARITLRPRGGLPMRLMRRQPEQGSL